MPGTAVSSHAPRIRWHIVVFLAPAVLVYTAVMILPLFDTLRLALYDEIEGQRVFVGKAAGTRPAVAVGLFLGLG